MEAMGGSAVATKSWWVEQYSGRKEKRNLYNSWTAIFSLSALLLYMIMWKDTVSIAGESSVKNVQVLGMNAWPTASNTLGTIE